METTSPLSEEQAQNPSEYKIYTAVAKRTTTYVRLTVSAAIALIFSVSMWLCYKTVEAEAYARYIGIKNVSSEKLSKTIYGIEISAKNIFDEVAKNMGSPAEVISALESKANMNRDVCGYFAAFEPNYFPEKGTWFEPYVFQSDAVRFELRQVGSARHNYMKSPWYVRAKSKGEIFWSEPYYYYDGTNISGHYCTFIKPIYDANGKLACVCGADIMFEWLAKELAWVDETSKKSDLLNIHHLVRDFGFYTVLLDKDGTCLAHPEEKSLTITDKNMLRDLERQTSGVMDLDVNGEACTVYYGPVEFIDWTLAVVVPRRDFLMTLLPVGIVLSLIAIIGIIIAWSALSKLDPKKEY